MMLVLGHFCCFCLRTSQEAGSPGRLPCWMPPPAPEHIQVWGRHQKKREVWWERHSWSNPIPEWMLAAMGAVLSRFWAWANPMQLQWFMLGEDLPWICRTRQKSELFATTLTRMHTPKKWSCPCELTTWGSPRPERPPHLVLQHVHPPFALPPINEFPNTLRPSPAGKGKWRRVYLFRLFCCLIRITRLRGGFELHLIWGLSPSL